VNKDQQKQQQEQTNPCADPKDEFNVTGSTSDTVSPGPAFAALEQKVEALNNKQASKSQDLDEEAAAVNDVKKEKEEAEKQDAAALKL
jgi:hypothetical protein